MPVLSLVILSIVVSDAGVAFLRICGHVRRPPTGGSASSKMMSRGDLQIYHCSCIFVCLLVVCDVRVRFTMFVCALRFLFALVLRSWSVRCSKSLWGCCLNVVGSIM